MSLFSQIVQFLLTGITIGTIYGMVALGFNIIYNATGIDAVKDLVSFMADFQKKAG